MQVAELEQMYSPQKLAELWSVHPKTIQRMFIDEPGVLLIGQEGKHLTIRIPESVAKRVYSKRKR